MSEDDSIKTLVLKFAEKNPTFIRLIMEMHYTKGEFESSQGKIIRFNFDKINAKENK